MFYPFSYYLFCKLNHLYILQFSFLKFCLIPMQLFRLENILKAKKQLIFDLCRNFFLTLFSTAFICFSFCFSIVFVYFSKAFPNGEYVNLAYSIIFPRLEDNIFSPGRYSYLSFFQIIILLVSYCSFFSLILSSLVMISFNIFYKIFFLKCEKVSDARVVSIN